MASQQAALQDARQKLDRQAGQGDRARAQESAEVAGLQQALAELEQQKAALSARVQKSEAEIQHLQQAARQPRAEETEARRRSEELQQQLAGLERALAQAREQAQSESSGPAGLAAAGRARGDGTARRNSIPAHPGGTVLRRVERGPEGAR